LNPRSTGRLLSQDSKDFVIVSRQCEHSGWTLLVDVLYYYVRHKRLIPGSPTHATSSSTGNRTSHQTPVVLRLEHIGLELDPDGDSFVVAATLDLLCTVISDNQVLAAQVLSSLENGGDVQAVTGVKMPDLVQLTTLILEDTFVCSAWQRIGSPPESAFITLTMGPTHAHPGPAAKGTIWLDHQVAEPLCSSPRAFVPAKRHRPASESFPMSRPKSPAGSVASVLTRVLITKWGTAVIDQSHRSLCSRGSRPSSVLAASGHVRECSVKYIQGHVHSPLNFDQHVAGIFQDPFIKPLNNWHTLSPPHLRAALSACQCYFSIADPSVAPLSHFLVVGYFLN